MESFAGQIAVVTGGGTGMGRELVRQLAAEGCHVAMCDIFAEPMDECAELALEHAPAGTRVTRFVADVSDEAQLHAFAEAVAEDQVSEHVNLLFNNAGVGGGGSFVADERSEWDKTFGICWGGVYGCTRAFLPMLMRAQSGHVVNTSSVNGLWASLGPAIAHTAYSAAKFAVRGFTEALINDFRLNAPHLQAHLVMPGHIGTSIVLNSNNLFGRNPKELTEEQLVQMRERMGQRGFDVSGASDEDLRMFMQMGAEGFRDNAPTSAAQAATIILDAVKAGEWRILVGDDAVAVDSLVREFAPEAYDDSFIDKLRERQLLGFAIT